MQSIKVKLLLWYLLIQALVLSSFNYALYLYVENNLHNNLYGSLETHEAIEHFLTRMWIITPFILLLSSFGGYFLMNKYFEPLKDMLRDIHTITAKDLALRIKKHPNNAEINELALAFNAMLDRLQRSFHAMKSFNANASHELRTPLTIMRGEIEIALRKERSCEAYKDILENQLEEVIGLQKLMEDLLFLAEADLAYTRTNFVLIDMDEVLNEAIKTVSNMAAAKNISLKAQCITPYKCFANAELLTIAFSNLLKNAIDYSHNESEVIVDLIRNTQGATLRIVDGGIGIAKEKLASICESFYKVDQGRAKSSTQGCGLGLAITKAILDLHHAQLRYESEENKGTTVHVTFASPSI